MNNTCTPPKASEVDKFDYFYFNNSNNLLLLLLLFNLHTLHWQSKMCFRHKI